MFPFAFVHFVLVYSVMKIKYVVTTRKIFTSLNKMIKCMKMNQSIEMHIVKLVNRKDILLTNF